MAYDENIYAKIISGELNENEINQLKASGEWQEIQMILDATDELSLSPHNKEDGYAKLIKERDQRRPKGKRRFLFQLASVAAVGLLVLGIFLFNRDKEVSTIASNGKMAEVILADNTQITLNDGSSLRYKDKTNDSNRMVKLNGEAFFNVTPGNKFIVETDKGFIEVLGTQFNVRAWGTKLFVECYSGRVAVVTNSNRKELNPNDAVVVLNGQIGEVSKVENEKPNWLKGTSRFQQEPLSEVFRELERQYDIKIKLPNIDRPFSGAFAHDHLQNALDEVCSPMGLQFKIVNPGLVEVYE